ncbi:MAG: citrate lyase holo-[acyl-carrier protein] synthase [Treponemataceae bacterium]
MDPFLAEMLAERDRREYRRTVLATEYKATIVQLTIVAPGVRKDSPDIRKAFWYGKALLENVLTERGLRTLLSESREGNAGPCSMWVVEAEAALVKRAAVGLEDGYSLGRLWDFDVYGPGGLKLDREAVGSDARKCFVCESPAAICAGRRLHGSAEVVRCFMEILERGIEDMDKKGAIG